MAVRTAPSLDRVGRGAPLPASDRPGLRRPSPVAVVLVTLSGAALAAYVWVALSRMGSPGALEWMEGGVAGHVGRVLAGHSVYGPPSLSFTPYLYTPLFYYVGAAFSAVLGAGLWPLRLVSFLSSIALVAAIGRLVWWDTRSRWAAAGAAGLFLACFRLGGAWLDLARVDTLCLALLMWSLVLARGATGARRAALAGFLAVLAVMTKQVALVPALAVIPHLAIGGRRRAAAYSLTLGAGLAAATVLLQVTSRGWFLYYALRLPLHHRIVTAAVGRFWTVDLVSHLWPALVVV
ncbi:MAG TPA: glycosyltransferase family 39 protein, partial [Acidimicrobiales bacterium]|nr:glycosyltransferase family 39 protein [Acidimicrobiales bacterium]